MCNCMTGFSLQFPSGDWSKKCVLFSRLDENSLADQFLDEDDNRGSGRLI